MSVRNAAVHALNQPKFRLDAENFAVYTYHRENSAKGELYIRKRLFSGQHFEIINHAKTDGNFFLKGCSHIAHFVNLVALKFLVLVHLAKRNSNQDLYNKTVNNLRNLSTTNPAVSDLACALLGVNNPAEASARITTLERLEGMLRQNIADLRVDNQNLVNANANLVQQGANLQQNLDRAQADLQTAQQDLNQANADLQAVQQDLIQANHNLALRENQMNRANDRIDDLTNNLNNTTGDLNHAEDHIRVLTQYIDGLRDQDSDEHALFLATAFEGKGPGHLDDIRQRAVSIVQNRPTLQTNVLAYF